MVVECLGKSGAVRARENIADLAWAAARDPLTGFHDGGESTGAPLHHLNRSIKYRMICTAKCRTNSREREREEKSSMPPTRSTDASDRATSDTARFEARITPHQKALFERAAALSGCTLSEFVINSAQEIAARMVRDQEVMTSGGRDRKAFVAALLKSSAPGRRLRQAARRYNKATGQ